MAPTRKQAQQPAPDPMLSMAEFGRRISASDDTVRRMIARGELRAFRVGARLVRIPESELDRIMSPIVPAALAG